MHWTAISEEIAEAYEHTKQAFDPSLIADASPLMEELAEVILPAVEGAFEQIKTKPERVAYREEMYTQDQIETAANYLVEQGEMELFKQDVKLARAKFSRAIELCPDVKAYKRKLNDTFTISGQQAARATSQKIEHVSSNTMGVMSDE